jgi:hypothetical protein
MKQISGRIPDLPDIRPDTENSWISGQIEPYKFIKIPKKNVFLKSFIMNEYHRARQGPHQNVHNLFTSAYFERFSADIIFNSFPLRISGLFERKKYSTGENFSPPKYMKRIFCAA